MRSYSSSSCLEVADNLDNIATVYSAQGKHDIALNKYMESLNKKKDYFGSNTKTIGIALSLHNIGYEYRHLNMYHEAGVFLQHALSVLKNLYPGGIIKKMHAINHKYLI